MKELEALPQPDRPATRSRLRLRLTVVLSAIPAADRGRASARRAARNAVACGVAAFGLLTLGLVAAAETLKPEWRDPEYGHRLQAARAWQRERPDRPLVLVVGSSRAQLGVSPAHMDFPDGPGSPLVYNFGHCGAPPFAACLQVRRAHADGLRPRAVLLLLALQERHTPGTAEQQVARFTGRLSMRDVELVAPRAADPAGMRLAHAAARRNVWASYLPAVVSDLAPGYQSASTRSRHVSWERMDAHGFSPQAAQWTSAEHRRQLLELTETHRAAINDISAGADCDRAVRDLVAWGRAEGVVVAVAWAPESPTYRAMYTPRARADADAYTHALTHDLGIPVFPAPVHLTDGDFLDGYHVHPAGAAKYSRWLADEHLKPWLAGALK